MLRAAFFFFIFSSGLPASTPNAHTRTHAGTDHPTTLSPTSSLVTPSYSALFVRTATWPSVSCFSWLRSSVQARERMVFVPPFCYFVSKYADELVLIFRERRGRRRERTGRCRERAGDAGVRRRTRPSGATPRASGARCAAPQLPFIELVPPRARRCTTMWCSVLFLLFFYVQLFIVRRASYARPNERGDVGSERGR